MEFRHGVRVAVAVGLLPVLLGALRAPQGRPEGPPMPQPGYHHLGATTSGGWAGVLGQVTVRDTGVRPNTFDFVATRFMAKAGTPSGTKWLEAGWAQTGWSDPSEQRVYTFDTNTLKWTFYDQYPIKPGDQVWIELTAANSGPSPAWTAWLWWHDAWHQLTTQSLPITEHATIEEYVEVYVDPAHDGKIAVPPVDVDNVQLKADPGSRFQFWTDAVDTAPGTAADGYCLGFQVPFDAWHAGTC